MSEVTEAARVNRILAEFMGYRDIAPMIEGGALWGYAPGGPSVPLPDYWNSADAILPVVERLCRERGLSLAIELGQLGPAFASDNFVVVIGEYAPGGREWHARHQHLAAAAALACAAVIQKQES